MKSKEMATMFDKVAAEPIEKIFTIEQKKVLCHLLHLINIDLANLLDSRNVATMDKNQHTLASMLFSNYMHEKYPLLFK